MKLSGIHTATFVAVIAAFHLKNKRVWAQNDNDCSANDLVFQCPDPAGTVYANLFDSYVANPTVSYSEVGGHLEPMDQAEYIATSVQNMVFNTIGGFVPWLNAGIQIYNMALGLTSMGEDDSYLLAKQTNQALQNIVDNFNSRIDELENKIDERFDVLENYTEDLISSSVYLSDVKGYRDTVKNRLEAYEGRVEDGVEDGKWNETSVLNDMSGDDKDYLAAPLEDAVFACHDFFGSADITPGDTTEFDEDQEAMFRLMYAQEMCSGCLSVYSSRGRGKNLPS